VRHPDSGRDTGADYNDTIPILFSCAAICPGRSPWYTFTTMNEKPQRKRPNPRFLCSAAFSKDFPLPQGEEYAIVGRSNVGKSSFLNHVLERQGLARTSRTPGKTSLANFYRVDETMVWVDLPGYGYARSSGSERERWSKGKKEKW